MSDPLDGIRAALGGRYEVQRELGSGGMATVYLATDLKHDRPVAIKVLRPELSATLGADRFHREIQIAARLQHPHILGLLDSGQAGGLLYYVMPFVEGESLRERLERDRELPVGEAVRVLRDVTDALAYAHGKGVVHRDIKPENVMLSGRHALVADFGVAKAVSDAAERQRLTTAGVALGTPAYMAPEQASADPHMDHRVDLYAVGAMAYELLTGQPPFGGASPQAILAKQVTEEPVPVTRQRPAVPQALADLVMRCLEKRPADRYQSAEEMLSELDQLATPSGGTTPAEMQPYRADSSKRRWALVGAGAVVVLLVATFVVVRLRGRPGGGAAAATAAGTASSSARAAAGVTESDSVPSVGVLPFTELSAAPGQAYFADGLTGEVIGALSKIQGLRVPGPISSMHFKGSKAPLKVIADSLHVRSILSATIQRDGDRVRIRADLVNAADGYELWSHTYQARSEDLFAVYDQVARGIAGALSVKLGSSHTQVAASTTSSARAYNAYLLGRYQLNQRTTQSIDSARTAFQSAIRADSGYALAWSGLADAYSLSTPINYGVQGIPPDTALSRALRAARRAVDLDSTSAEAHTSLALAYDAEWEWARADTEWHRALALDPGYAPAREWYGIHLDGSGRFDEALVQLRRAEELDPLAFIYGDWVGWTLNAMGRHEAAAREFDRLVGLHPDNGRLYRDAGLVALANRDFDRAATDLSRMWELAGDSARARRWREGLGRPTTRRATALGLVRAALADTSAMIGTAMLTADIAVVMGDTALADTVLSRIPVRRGYWSTNYQRTWILDPALQRTAIYRKQLRAMGVQ